MDKTLMYLAVVNVFAFVLYGADKYFAVRGKWRISERNLLLIAAVGGSLGAYLAMNLFRHKTKHKKFTVGVPLIFLLQVFLAAFLRTR